MPVSEGGAAVSSVGCRQGYGAGGEQPGTEGVGVEVVLDVGGMDDGGQTDQCRIGPEVEVVDEDFEGAASVAVVELGPRCVEAVGVLVVRDGQDVIRGYVEDLGVGVDEASDQPGTSDTVGLGAARMTHFTGAPPGEDRPGRGRHD